MGAYKRGATNIHFGHFISNQCRTIHFFVFIHSSSLVWNWNSEIPQWNTSTSWRCSCTHNIAEATINCKWENMYRTDEISQIHFRQSFVSNDRLELEDILPEDQMCYDKLVPPVVYRNDSDTFGNAIYVSQFLLNRNHFLFTSRSGSCESILSYSWHRFHQRGFHGNCICSNSIRFYK